MLPADIQDQIYRPGEGEVYDVEFNKAPEGYENTDEEPPEPHFELDVSDE
jgi:hypothetical protein